MPATKSSEQVGGNFPDNWSPLIKRLSNLHSLTSNEISALKKLHEHKSSFDEHRVILYEGDQQKTCMIILRGWAYRYSTLENGGRQVINYYIPGDIISPFALVQPKVNYSIESLTHLDVFTFKPEFLLQIFSEEPRLGIIYGQILGREDSISAEQIVRLGRRSAYQRTAHLLLELFYRLKKVGRTNEETYLFPLTQELLADTLGMSFVHMNRTLRKLRINNLIEQDSNKMTLLDIDELVKIAEYKHPYKKLS